MNIISYMVRGKDVFLAGFAGLLIGLLALPILLNLSFVGIFGDSWLALAGFAIGFAILTAAGMLVARSLSKYLPIFLQLAKFIVVGVLNTLVDLGVLNLLIFAVGITLGPAYVVFKSISFIAAVSNSYVWNKYWTFGSGNKDTKEIAQFFAVSIVGFFLNVGIASAIANFVSIAGFSPQLMANVGALSGTVLGLIWNFLGYKFIVFKKTQDTYGSL